MKAKRIAGIGLLAVVALAADGAIAYQAGGAVKNEEHTPRGDAQTVKAVKVSGSIVDPAYSGSAGQGFTAVAKRTMPAVVNISSSKTVRERNQDLVPFFNDPFFQRFFGDQNRVRSKRGFSPSDTRTT